MAIIKPTLTLTSNSDTYTPAASAGPLSFALSLSNADSLTVGTSQQNTSATSTTPSQILDGYGITGGTWTPGAASKSCYLYMLNTDATDNIYIGIVSNCDDNSATATGTNTPLAPDTTGQSGLAETTNITLRTMTLKPGEFAWFPWDMTGDIWIQASDNTPTLEWWRFDRA